MGDDAERQAREKALEYFRTRGTGATPAVIHQRVQAAFASLDALLEKVTAAQAPRRPQPGEWSVQEIVDHLVETHRAGLDELRCLLAGERPPGGPIPAGLQSKAPLHRPWPWLLSELRRVHGDILGLLASVPADFTTAARAPLVMVVNVPREGGRQEPLSWVEDVDWKSYAIVWRLHVVDHLHQAQAALGKA